MYKGEKKLNGKSCPKTSASVETLDQSQDVDRRAFISQNLPREPLRWFCWAQSEPCRRTLPHGASHPG